MPAVLRLDRESRPGEADFACLFEHSPDPAAYVSSDLKVTAYNRKFREFFPVLIEEELVGPLQMVLKDRASSASAGLPVLRPYRPTALGNYTPGLKPKAVWLPDGGALIIFRPMASEELSTHQNLQRLSTKLEDAERRASEAMRQVERYQERLSVASHELRTPLNAIIGFSDIMRQQLFGPLGDARYLRYAELLHDSGSRLLEMINDFLDLSKINAGKLDLSPETIEVLRVIVDTVRELEVLAAKSHVCFGIHVFDGVSLLVADDKRLHQMLLNLISNALKFTPSGGEISIDVFRRGADIAISVSDTGVGMAEKDLAVALQPFGQVKSSAGPCVQGTGLGLPLTKQLAELHGGKLELESQPGRGTTVTILLPERGKEPNGKQGQAWRETPGGWNTSRQQTLSLAR